MPLPIKIDIQIVDEKGNHNSLSNVLFGLKIFISENSWHNYSAFKTDECGHISLQREDIINNTELKYSKDVLSGVPTKFELYVWEGKQTEDMIKITEHLLTLYDNEDFIVRDLKKHGVEEKNISHALSVTENKAREDNNFFELIKSAVNNSVNIVTYKIIDVWNDELEKSYTFMIF